MFTHVEPFHESQIAEYLHGTDRSTAVTGNGVNDAPNIKKAKIGIPMGSDTAGAKSASGMILDNINCASIVAVLRRAVSSTPTSYSSSSSTCISAYSTMAPCKGTCVHGRGTRFVPSASDWPQMVVTGALYIGPPGLPASLALRRRQLLLAHSLPLVTAKDGKCVANTNTLFCCR